MDRQRLKGLLKPNEGTNIVDGRHRLYKCTAGKQTIGWGYNIEDNGISNAIAEALLDEGIDECLADLNNNLFPEFFLYPETVQLVLADMRFNLGPRRFRSFKKMIAAVKKQDWAAMAQEMEDSKWCNDVKTRCVTLVKMVDSLENLPTR
jgi:lysozyme